MLETDADRLDMLRALGAVLVSSLSGSFMAVFDRDYVGQTLGAIEIESRGPALTCLTSDVSRLGLTKDVAFSIPGETDSYRMKKHEPDGTGMSVLHLRK